jgi:hypothetical protein
LLSFFSSPPFGPLAGFQTRPCRQIAFNETTDFKTLSIRDSTVTTLLKQLRTVVK